MADADAQTPEVGADVRDRVAQAVVAAVTAAEFETGFADGRSSSSCTTRISAGVDLQIVGQRANRESAAIHVRRRLEQRDFIAVDGTRQISP